MKRRKFIYCINTIGCAMSMGLYPAIASTGEPDFRKSAVNSNSIDQGLGEAYCEIRQYNGYPTLFIANEPYFPMAFISYYPKQFRYKNMRDAGIRFFSLEISLGDRFIGSYRQGRVKPDRKGIWDAPGTIDFQVLDDAINEILEVAPDSYIFPRIFCDSPSWWDSFHPAETCRTYKGLPQRQSFSSLIWRDETAETLRKIVSHIRRSSYSDRIIGVHVAAGQTEEWTSHDWSGPVDYSLVSEKRFKNWLLKKYNNDKSLIESYFCSSIDQITIPSPEQREQADFGDLLDPKKSRIVIDYQTFICEEIVESAKYLCRAVKEESHGNMITGVFYGYTFARRTDHFALSLMLDSPDVDFISHPNGHNINTIIGDNHISNLLPLKSVQKANKLLYLEADVRTCLSKFISDIQPDIDPYREYTTSVWLGQETIEKSVELLKLVFSRVICNGYANWWFDLWGGWYDHDKFLNLFSEMQAIGNESIHIPRDSLTEVCVIVDENTYLNYPSFYHITPSKAKFPSWIVNQVREIEKIGAPYDLYLFDDFDDLDITKYKIIIFLNPLLFSQKAQEMVMRKCMANEQILLWLYAPGMINSTTDTISVSNVSSFINMDIDYAEKYSESDIRVNLPNRELNYTGEKMNPFLYIKGGADAVYGHTKEGYAILGEKIRNNCLNVLACVPPLPSEIIRYYAMKSGVHIYSKDGDMVYANQSYLSIIAHKSGRRKIMLQSKMGLKELLGNGAEFKSAKEHEICFEEESCKFFKILKI